MSKFRIQSHGRLQEWVAEEKGYFKDEGLDYEFLVRPIATWSSQIASSESAPAEVRQGAYESYEAGPRLSREFRVPLGSRHGCFRRAWAHVGSRVLRHARWHLRTAGISHQKARRPRECRSDGGLSLGKPFLHRARPRAISQARRNQNPLWRPTLGPAGAAHGSKNAGGKPLRRPGVRCGTARFPKDSRHDFCDRFLGDG